MSTDNLRLTEREKRMRHNPRTPGKTSGDHAGHLIADRFGGSPELDNLVSQLSSVNLKIYKYHENLWAEALHRGSKVELRIQVLYEGEDMRPSGFKLDYKIDRVKYNIPIIYNN